jgi:hypothetical protein
VEEILVYDPAAPVADAPSQGGARASSQRAVRFDDLRERVVGFIDNAKPNFQYLVDDLSELLVSRYGVAKVVKHRKRGQVPVAHDVLQDMAERCDVVITGSGD